MVIHEQPKASVMESLVYINDIDPIYRIPVIESNNGSYLIDLESLVSYCEDSGIQDYGIGLSKITEANQIDSSKIQFCVEEVSVLLSDKLQRLVSNLLEAQIPCWLKPLPKNDPEYGFNEGYFDNDKIDWEDDKQTFDLLMRDLKKANAPQSLIDKAEKMHKDGMSAAQIRKWHSENKYFHPDGEVGDSFLYQNDNNQHKQERAGAKFERRERRMKGIGKILSSKENREDEARFNANKERTLRYLKHHGKLMDPNRSTFNLSWHDNAEDDTKNDVKNIKVRFNRHIGAEDKELPDRLKQLSSMVEKEQFPKTWLAKKIAWLRSLYKEFMMKHTVFKASMKDLAFGDKIKNVAAMILRLIDKLAQKLQNAVN